MYPSMLKGKEGEENPHTTSSPIQVFIYVFLTHVFVRVYLFLISIQTDRKVKGHKAICKQEPKILPQFSAWVHLLDIIQRCFAKMCNPGSCFTQVKNNCVHLLFFFHSWAL